MTNHPPAAPLATLLLLLAPAALAQPTTVLPEDVIVGLANTVSGSRPLANLTDIAGYNRDRDAEEFAGTYHESEVLAARARAYGFSDVEIQRYPRGPVWDGIRGELWVTTPVLRKIVDFKDIPTALAPGSMSGTYEGEMVWVDDAGDPDAYEHIDVEGKIVLCDASTGGAYRQATRRGALGVVNLNAPRPYVLPDAILWSSIRPSREQEGFAFNLSAPMFRDLKMIRGPVTLRRSSRRRCATSTTR